MSDARNRGRTEAERYLAQLCKRTFLSLWSYPSVCRDVFVPGTRIGKEVCDLLVIFEDRVLIFSDKDCAVPQTGKPELDWSRWFRSAVAENAKQAFGAERWLRQFPNRVFLDRECQKRLPMSPIVTERTRFHLIVVAHRIAARCKEVLGGSGSLMIRSDVKGKAAHILPFTVGDYSPSDSFVHVLDDTALEVLMRELDTIADFVAYLDEKEALLRSGMNLFAAGEEELLSWYLRHVDSNGKHYFALPSGDMGGIALSEGMYADYLVHPQRIAKGEADEVSYAWDRLIEKFSFHALGGTQYFSTSCDVTHTEQILRWMAREPRVRRRMLARKLVECLVTTPEDIRRTAVLLPSFPGEPYYLFLLLPWNHERSADENRVVRRKFLEGACSIVRLKWPDAEDVVGIATESGKDFPRRTEDAVWGDFRQWTEKMEAEAKEFQEVSGVLVEPREVRQTEFEYPEPKVSPEVARAVGRNEPCPCGSGRKYKKCHGRPSRGVRDSRDEKRPG